MLHVFYLTSGFHYFFAKRIIAQKNIQDPIFVTNFHREIAMLDSISRQSARVFHVNTGLQGRCTLDKQLQIIQKTVMEICKIDDDSIRFYAMNYRFDGFPLRYFVKPFKRAFKNSQFNLLPDGVNLLASHPIRGNKKYLLFLWQRMYKKFQYPGVSLKHFSGSYSRLIHKIYHFPVDIPIHAPRKKIEWIAIDKPETTEQTDKVLLIGGTAKSFKQTMGWCGKNFQQEIIYRPHPQRFFRRGKIRYAKELGFEILADLDIPLEEYIFQKHFVQIVGSFSTTLVIAHLFCPETETIFLYDKENAKDRVWRPVAESVGLKIVEI